MQGAPGGLMAPAFGAAAGRRPLATMRATATATAAWPNPSSSIAPIFISGAGAHPAAFLVGPFLLHHKRRSSSGGLRVRLVSGAWCRPSPPPSPTPIHPHTPTHTHPHTHNARHRPPRPKRRRHRRPRRPHRQPQPNTPPSPSPPRAPPPPPPPPCSPSGWWPSPSSTRGS